MNGNALFIIILIIIYGFAVYGKHRGLFQTLMPVLTVFFSVYLIALVLPDFAKRLASDAGKLDMKELVIDALAFGITFFAVRFVFGLLLKILKPVIELPVIENIDRTLGLFAGLVAGITAVWLVFFLGLFFLGTEGMEPLFKLMDKSVPLKFIYNHNLLMTFINKMVFG